MTGRPSFSEQLRPISERLFPKRARIVPVTQITADVIAKNDRSDVLAEARTQVLRWMRNRAGSLPAQAWKHEDFEVNESGTQAAAVRIQTPEADYWTARLDHIDEKVARNWTTEIALAHFGGRAMFGARLTMSTMEEEPTFFPSVPGIVLQLAENPGLAANERILRAEPWIVSTEDDVDELVSLLCNSLRRQPVFVVSLDEGESDPKTAAINSFNLARLCIGIAHVVVLPSLASFALSNRVGKEFSVFRGAVRTYRPGFDFIEGNPYSHPLTLPERIKSWGNNGNGASDFLAHLVRHAATESIIKIDPDRELPSFAKVKQASLEHRREGAAQSGDLRAEIKLLKEQNASLEEISKTTFDMALAEEEARRSTEDRLRDVEADNSWLRQRIQQLENQIEKDSGVSIDANIPIPQTLSEMKSWAQEYLTGRLVITGRAARACKDSLFDDVEYVYRVVLIMANEYRNMRIFGGTQTQKIFEDTLQKFELENSRTGDETRLREQGNEFLVDFQGQKRLLEWHLKKPGNTRDPSRCFRLYYFWDDNTQQVVIGAMPGHLSTRAT